MAWYDFLSGKSGDAAKRVTDAVAEKIKSKPSEKSSDTGVFQKIGNFFGGGSDGVTVEKGQTLGGIAKERGISLEELMKANPNITDPNKIQAGAKLNIPGQEGFLESKSNRNLLGYGTQLAGAGAGYLAGRQTSKAQEGILDQYASDISEVGSRIKSLGREDVPRGESLESFLNQQIAAGGITPEMQMQSRMGLRKAGAASQSAMEKAKEEMARTGGGSAAAARALTGSQGQQIGNTVADVEQQLVAMGAQNVEQAQKAKYGLEENRFKNIKDLFSAQDAATVSKANLAQGLRDRQIILEGQKGQQLGNLISAGTDVAQQAISNYEPAQKTASQQFNQRYQKQPNIQQGSGVGGQPMWRPEQSTQVVNPTMKETVDTMVGNLQGAMNPKGWQGVPYSMPPTPAPKPPAKPYTGYTPKLKFGEY